MEHAAVPSMIREQRLNRWIEDYSDSIMRTCFLYLSDQTQAEDATQDTWIKAWKHMDDFERKGMLPVNTQKSHTVMCDSGSGYLQAVRVYAVCDAEE